MDIYLEETGPLGPYFW